MKKNLLPLLPGGLIFLSSHPGRASPDVSVGFSAEGPAQTLVLAARYLAHWQSRRDGGEDYCLPY